MMINALIKITKGNKFWNKNILYRPIIEYEIEFLKTYNILYPIYIFSKNSMVYDYFSNNQENILIVDSLEDIDKNQNLIITYGSNTVWHSDFIDVCKNKNNGTNIIDFILLFSLIRSITEDASQKPDK